MAVCCDSVFNGLSLFRLYAESIDGEFIAAESHYIGVNIIAALNRITHSVMAAEYRIYIPIFRIPVYNVLMHLKADSNRRRSICHLLVGNVVAVSLEQIFIGYTPILPDNGSVGVYSSDNN